MAKKPFGARWKPTGGAGLGGGGQGDIVRVVDVTGKQPGEYALKRLRDVNRIDRFRNEVEALKRLNHPRIVKIIDHSALTLEKDEGPHFIVMPIAEGRDAEKRIDLFRGNIENVLHVGIQTAEALAAAHRVDVVHRDVKPANILFPGEGLDIWLTDFGICRIEKDERDTPPGFIMGPRRFAAPEIEEGVSEVSPSVDVYSLGQVLFNLLSGGRVFFRENVHDAQHDASFPPGEQAKWLRVLLGKMVAVKERRIETMEEVGAELHRVSNWELIASTGALPQQALAELAALRRRVQQEARDDVDVDRDIADLNAIRAGVETGVTALIEDKVKAAADQIRQGRDLDAGLSSERLAKVLRIGAIFRCAELDVRRLTIGKLPQPASLCFVLYQKNQPVPVRKPAPKRKPAVPSADETIYLLMPFVAKQYSKVGPPVLSFLKNGEARQVIYGDPALKVPIGELNEGELPDHLEFALPEWPGNAQAVANFVDRHVTDFLKYLSTRPKARRG